MSNCEDASREEPAELEQPPEQVLDGLVVGRTETGRRYTVSIEELEEHSRLLLDKEQSDDVLDPTPAEFERWMYVEGQFYVPEYSPAWEVNEALSQLAGESDE